MKADPSVLAVFQDYVKLMPLVAEANQMSEELGKVRLGNSRNGLGYQVPHTLPPTALREPASWWRHADARA